MKAIETIKKSINQNISYIINTSNGYPELSYVKEQTERFRAYIQEGIQKMIASELFTKDELQEIADFAEELIIRRANNALETLKALKREAYKF